MMAAVKHRAESFKNWVASVQDILETKANKKRGQSTTAPPLSPSRRSTFKPSEQAPPSQLAYCVLSHEPFLTSLCLPSPPAGLEELRSLVEQAEAGAYPKTGLQRQLRALTLDAEKCASMAQQLLNGKRQTRYPHGTIPRCSKPGLCWRTSSPH